MAMAAPRETTARQLDRAANSLISASGLDRPSGDHQSRSGSSMATVPIGWAQEGSSGVPLVAAEASAAARVAAMATPAKMALRKNMRASSPGLIRRPVLASLDSDAM